VLPKQIEIKITGYEYGEPRHWGKECAERKKRLRMKQIEDKNNILVEVPCQLTKPLQPHPQLSTPLIQPSTTPSLLLTTHLLHNARPQVKP
jgi:hypothetical protein